jgi:cysteine desulfuration protein SufE
MVRFRFVLLFKVAATVTAGVTRLEQRSAFAMPPNKQRRAFALAADTDTDQKQDPSATAPTGTGNGAPTSSNPMSLTPELLKIANAFEAIGDDKLRYKQLLHMASQLEPMDHSSKIPQNKVPGCLSTVFVHGKAVDKDGSTLIHFSGDSDGLLTKGLVALLVRGLSGNTAEAIQQVDSSICWLP